MQRKLSLKVFTVLMFLLVFCSLSVNTRYTHAQKAGFVDLSGHWDLTFENGGKGWMSLRLNEPAKAGNVIPYKGKIVIAGVPTLYDIECQSILKSLQVKFPFQLKFIIKLPVNPSSKDLLYLNVINPKTIKGKLDFVNLKPTQTKVSSYFMGIK